MNKIEIMINSLAKCKTYNDYLKAVRAFGLINDISPTIYGDERKYMNATREELGVYQTPVQFAKLLLILSKMNIKSYCEIGVFRGGTFLFISQLLRRNNPAVQLIAVDPTLNENIHEDARPYVMPYHIPGTSHDIKGKEFDLVLIDGDHNYGWALCDWQFVGQYAKICIFHDINEPTCPGVTRIWNELKQDSNYTSIELCDSIGGVATQGIGVLIRNDSIEKD